MTSYAQTIHTLYTVHKHELFTSPSASLLPAPKHLQNLENEV